MQIIVSLMVEIPASADINEGEIHSFARGVLDQDQSGGKDGGKLTSLPPLLSL